MKRYKIEIYTPEEYIEPIRDAMNATGACHAGNYDNCLSYFEVYGYWRPLEGSNPYGGDIGKINQGTEFKIETVCDEEYLEAVISAVRKVHPYEEPMIHIIPLHQLDS